VPLSLAKGREGLWTKPAFKGHDFVVLLLVGSPVLSRVEALFALVAREDCEALVTLHVGAEVFSLHKTFTADSTGERSFSGVAAGVFFKRLPIRETAVTSAANVRHVFDVGDLVFLQGLGSGELLSAHHATV